MINKEINCDSNPHYILNSVDIADKATDCMLKKSKPAQHSDCVHNVIE